MSKKTKEVLHNEILSLECQIHDMHKTIQKLTLKKEYWFAKAERYRCLYNKEKSSSNPFDTNGGTFKEYCDKELLDAEKIEKSTLIAIENFYSNEAKEELLMKCLA
ncbi:hypothetical protein [Fictibacillus sp. KU28468]|uniref:hypothetical protein n=1 Tax=Fictibacillus sp. KU28468 TaxID=2991053 RepID=UPI00223CBE0D|nr:hypothetical protein [Fictibacillus sp. KU28468]UZJ79429.1 hypothetical protein OKX00_02780 [Fictibacillus sp. KU28468]